MRYWALLATLLLLAGCGGTEPPPEKVDQPKKMTVKKEAPPPAAPKVDANAFSSIPAALEAQAQAAEAANPDEISRTEQWLVMQGAAAVEPLAAILKNEGAPLPQRIAVIRTLAQLPGAKNALLPGLESKERLVRVNVIQALGRIKPPDRQIIDKFIELAKTDDADNQRYALNSLGKMGDAAKDAVPLVQDMMNNKKYNDTVRDEARKTLRQIDPRRGLMGISGEDGK